MAPKRILVIGLTNRMGGVETFIKNILMSSDKGRVVFDFLVHDGTGSCQYEDEIKGFYAGDGEEHIFHVTPFKHGPIRCLVEIGRICSSRRYDWFHLHTGSPAEIVYTLPAVASGIHLIAHSHIGSGNDTLVQKIARLVLVNLSSCHLACSDSAARWLFGRKRAAEALLVHNGINVEEYAYSLEKRSETRSSLGVSDSTMLIGHIGRFHEMKNHRKLLCVFERFAEIQEDAVLCMVGVGELMDEIKQLASKLGISSKVRFLGARSDTAALFSAFDAFVMPSLFEGLPMVLVEAQASGLPVIISDTISSNAVIVPELCTVVPLGASDGEWADRIPRTRNADRFAYAEKVAQCGFDIRDVASKLESLYEGDSSGFRKVGDAQ